MSTKNNIIKSTSSTSTTNTEETPIILIIHRKIHNEECIWFREKLPVGSNAHDFSQSSKDTFKKYDEVHVYDQECSGKPLVAIIRKNGMTMYRHSAWDGDIYKKTPTWERVEFYLPGFC